MSEIQFENLQAAIAEQNRQKPYSGVITVLHKGKPVFTSAYGYANRSELLPNRLTTRFGIASGSKIFTAAAAGQLVAEGRLSYDARLVDFLEGALPEISPDVKLRHLLSHTSGVPDYFDEAVMDDYEAYWLDKPVYAMRSAQDFLRLIANQPMKSEPGTVFAYNNMGFILAGLMVEKTCGQRFQDYIEERIFGPAWMRSSGYFTSNQLPGNTALGYIDEEDGSWRTNQFAIPIVGQGDGGAYITAADMGRFWKALFEKRFFPQEILDEMLTAHMPVGEDGKSHYGYGVWMHDLAPVRCYYVVGEDPGVSFYAGIYPELDLQVTLLANSNEALWPMNRTIREALFPPQG